MERAFELGLYVLAAAATLAVGGVHATTQVVLAGAALLVFAGAMVGPLRAKGLRLPPPAWVALAALAWTALQLVPLPHALLAVLSPRAAELRAELGAGAAPITLDVAATRLELCKQVLYVVLFLLGVSLLRPRQATRRVAVALGIIGLLVVALSFAHRVLHLPFAFGLYAPHWHSGVGYFPPFVNGNHAASLLGLSALACFGLAIASERAARLGWLAAGAICTVALLITQSRGGAAGLALGGFVLGATLASARFGRTRGLLVAGVVLVTLGAGAIVLSDGLRGRLAQLEPTRAAWSNGKTRGWRVAEQLAFAYPLVGVGRGAFEAPAAVFRPDTEGVRLIYCDDVLLQTASEWGILLGLGLVFAALFTTLTLLVQLPAEPIGMGLLGGVVAVAFYGLLECGFEMPGVMAPFVLAVAALVARVEADRRERRRARPRAGGVVCVIGCAFAAILVVLGARAIPRTLDADSERLRADVHAGQRVSPVELTAAIARHPASAPIEMIAGELAMDAGDAASLHHDGRAMRLQPSLPRPHELAAIQLLRLRRPAQAALELRLAGERGQGYDDPNLVRLTGSFALDAVAQTPAALRELGATYARLTRYADADRAFARALELSTLPSDAARVREARMAAYAQAPATLRRAAVDDIVAHATSGDELAAALHSLWGDRDFARADAVAQTALARFPDSPQLVVEAARSLAARGDLDGARRAIGKIGRFDSAGRVELGELAVELAQRAGDVDGAAAAVARLKLLRARADLEKDVDGK